MKYFNRSILLFSIIMFLTSLNLIYVAKAVGLTNTFTFDVGEYKNGSFKTSIEVGLKLCFYDEQGNPHPVFPDKISIIITNLANNIIMTRESNPERIKITNTIKLNQNVIKIQCNLEDITNDIRLIVKIQSSQFTNNYMIENYDSSKITVEYLDSTDYDIFSFIILLNYIKTDRSIFNEPLVYIAIALPVFFISACIITLKIQKQLNNKGQLVDPILNERLSSPKKKSINKNIINQTIEQKNSEISKKPAIIESKNQKLIDQKEKTDNLLNTTPSDYLKPSKKIKNENFNDLIDNISFDEVYQRFESNRLNLKTDEEESNEEISQEDADKDTFFLK